jgi:hypothetical protein
MVYSLPHLVRTKEIAMKDWGRMLWLGLGLALGVAGTLIGYHSASRPALAGNDRAEDYIITTGSMTLAPNTIVDGIWILDYRAGKLLGTIVDKVNGKAHAWDEVDLVKEFNIPPKQNVHFMMTTGTTIRGHTALYLAEINTGRFGIYGMAPRGDGSIVIRRFDASVFRRTPVNPDP